MHFRCRRFSSLSPMLKYISTSLMLLVTLGIPHTNASGSHCKFAGAHAISSMLWVEAPTTISSVSQWTKYYTTLSEYLTSNCVNAKFSSLVLRTANPYLGSPGSILWPPKTSPLYTCLLKTISPTIKISFYPYLHEDSDREAWVNFGGSKSVIENVYIFTKGWNDFLKLAESKVRVTSLTVDIEELATSAKFQVTLNPKDIAQFKVTYGVKTLWTLIAYDDTVRFTKLIGAYDRIFLKFSGLLFPYSGAAQSEKDSPFLTAINQPDAMVSFVMQKVLPSVKKVYLPYLAKVTIMWSMSSASDTCLYPAANGVCGSNFEFGTWQPDTYNWFIRALSQASGDFFAIARGDDYIAEHVVVDGLRFCRCLRTNGCRFCIACSRCRL